ncbi:MAG: TIGR02391 family protein, partial [Xanthobacteraceae bacterium]
GIRLAGCQPNRVQARWLLKAYRRLEDLVRDRTGAQEHGTKLFSHVFSGNNPKLTWQNISDAERVGRALLFTAAYMAHRNPRAHRELKGYQDAQLSEFLILNHLFGLERQAQLTENAVDISL